MSEAYPNCSMCSEDLIPDDGELCGACARAVSETAKELIAAAEGRGRLAAAVVCKCGDELQPNDGAICGACLQPEIAEAEERGRRAGIEERDELRARLWEALSVIESRAPDMTLLIPRIKVALAPRDSGPKPEEVPCSSCDSIRGTHASWCHLYPFATNNPDRVAPRDSGKEG